MATASSKRRRSTRPGDQRIAVVGMAVTYAGCPNKEVFWDSLMRNEVNSSPLTEERLGTKNKALHYKKERSKYSDTFCNDKYGTISPEVTNEHDLLLNLANEALRDAASRKGVEKFDLPNCGIVSGCLSFPRDDVQGELLNLYQSHAEEKFNEVFDGVNLFTDQSKWSTRPTSQSPTAENKKMYLDPASFVADELNLNAVHYSVDAACATALYVLRLAQEHLLSGSADVMLAGASCLPDPFFIVSGFATFQAIPVADTPGDVSLPLNKKSTGLTPGEGGAIMVLKRLADAERDGDHIYGVLTGVGINNAGCGLPLKPHMPSELGCMEETYDIVESGAVKHGEPGYSKNVQYVECHATGTEQGDGCEINAMKSCFPNLPIFGSTKGNFGHTLVAAGFAGMCKLLTAMEKGVIPPTPGITDETRMDANVVQKAVPWPDTKGDVKRGGLSAFGFGGTNAHAVFEEYSLNRKAKILSLKPSAPNFPKLSIVGMDCHFGTLNGLAAFERALYNGGNGACLLPEKRWRFLGNDKSFLETLDVTSKPYGCFIDKVPVDFKRLRTPLTPEDMLLPQQLVAVKTIDKAILDANLKKGSRVAVLVGLGTDMELYRHRPRVALKERLQAAILEENKGMIMNALMDYIHDRGTSTSYTSYIGNLVATRISSQWGFTGPSFTITESESSVLRCLEVGRLLLAIGNVDAVVVAGVDMCGNAENLYFKTRRQGMSSKSFPQAGFSSESDGFFIGEGAGALVIKRQEDVNNKTDKSYATIDALVAGGDIRSCASKAISEAGLSSENVEMIEVSGIPEACLKVQSDIITSEEEISELGAVYKGKNLKEAGKSVSISSVKSNIGDTGYAAGAASLIKTALCLYNRYIPCTPNYKNPRNESSFPGAFYVNNDSRAWVKDDSKQRRHAVISSISESSSYFHTILTDVEGQHEEENLSSADPAMPKVVCIRANNVDGILAKLTEITSKKDSDLELEYNALLRDTIKQEEQPISNCLVLSLVASAATLAKEVSSALKGIPRAVKMNRDYASASGSFLTLKPLKSDKIAFMYGEGRSPYLGLGRDMYRVWPGMHEFVENRTTEMWAQNGDDEFHPRCLSDDEMKVRDVEFDKNMISNFRSGVFHSMCFTGLAEQKLGLKPKASFGLSLGEISMMFAFSEANSLLSNKMTSRLAESPVWNEELAVKCNAVRKKWNFPENEPLEKYWTGFMVQGSRAEIEAAIGNREDVRLMIVNNSSSALIAGKPASCREVIVKLGNKPALELPQRMIGHCPEVAPSVERIGKIHAALEIPQTEHQMYTTVTNTPIQKSNDGGKVLMKDHAGQIYLKVADFPAIVERVYADGYDTFVELGPNNHRAASVKDILTKKSNKIQQPHCATSIDREGKDTWGQIMAMMATLKSHQTPGVTLKSIYHESILATPAKPNKFLRSIEVNGRYKGISKSMIPDELLQKLKQSSLKFSHPAPYKKVRSLVAPKPKLKLPVPNRKIHQNPQDVQSTASDPEAEDDIAVDLSNLRSAFLQFDQAVKLPTVPGSRTKTKIVEPVTFADLGDKSFLDCYNVKAPLYTGAMAKGIASADIVIAMGERGMLGSFGAGGLPIHVIEKALDKIQKVIPDGPFAVNLIHSPFDPNLEKGCVDLLLKRGVTVIEASAFMQLTYDVVRYRVCGLYKLNKSESITVNNIGMKNKVIAKISRTELAEMFLRPAPESFLTKLLANGDITQEQYEMAKLVPMSDDICVESDSGGHTDNRPLHVIFPIVLNLRNRLHKELGYPPHLRVRVGAAGGIGCPEAALAAFNIGAAFVVTGTVNQVCRQSGSSDTVRKALSGASYSDVTMAPAADMFEQGVELQVLKKGTMFPSRAKKLRELFVKYDSFEEMPEKELKNVEKRIFRKSVQEVWEETIDFYVNHLKNPEKIARAEKDSKLKMSLCFRWYLGLSSFWANNGIKERAMDYQVWCGPAIGAFNDFIKGSYLDVKDPKSNGLYPCVVQTNLQILTGACYLSRVHQTQSFRDVDIDLDAQDLRTYRPTTPL